MTFLNSFISHPRGRIVLANIKYALDYNHIERELISSFLNECQREFINDKTLEHAPIDHIINMMMFVSDASDAYRFKRTPTPSPVTNYSSVVRWYVFTKHMLEPTVLNRLGIPILESEVTDGHFPLLEALCSDPKAFRPDAYIGNTRGLFWTTPSSVLSRIKVSGADEVRNSLGLVHYETGTPLIEVSTPQLTMAGYRHAAPTFIEAGDHRRFMANSDSNSGHDNWGQTVCLSSAWNPPICFSDGYPESVMERVSFGHDKGWDWKCLGIVGKLSESMTRGDESEKNERDNLFAEFIGGSPNWDNIVATLTNVMHNP